MSIDITQPGQFTNIRQDNGKSGIEIFKAAYFDRLINIAPGNLVGYWPMDETAGVVSNDYSGRAHAGAYMSVTLNNAAGPDGRGTPLFDAVNDYNNIYSVGFNADFDGQQGTALIWVKVLNVGIWTDGFTRYIMNLYVDPNNIVYLRKDSANNTIRMARTASVGVKAFNIIDNPINWFNIALTWDIIANQNKYYYNGILQSTIGAIGNFAGNLDINQTIIGAQQTLPALIFWGWLSHAAIWNRALSEDEIRLISRV